MAVVVAALLWLVTSSAAFELNLQSVLPSLQGSIQTEGKAEGSLQSSSSMTSSSSSSPGLSLSSLESTSGTIASAPAVVSSLTFPTETSFSAHLGLNGGAGLQFQGQAGDSSRDSSHSSESSSTITSGTSSQGQFSSSLSDKFGAGFGSGVSLSNAPAPTATSGQINIGLGAQGGLGPSFTSQETHYTSNAPAPAQVQGGFVSGSSEQLSASSSSAGSGALLAPPVVHGTIIMTSTSHSDQAAPAPVASSFSETKYTQQHQSGALAPPAGSATNVKTETVVHSSTQSSSSMDQSIYDPLSQPWVFMLEKRFWWLRSFLQKYLRSDFPWKVFSLHPKLWLNIGGGYLRQTSLNEFPFSANKLVWYHPDFDNYLYVYSRDSKEGFWSSPPVDAWSSLFKTNDGSYKIEFIPSELSVEALTASSDWSSSPRPDHSRKPEYFPAPAPSSSAAFIQSSNFKPQRYPSRWGDLKIPAAYAILSSNEQPISSGYQQNFYYQQLPAPAPRPSSQFSYYTSDANLLLDPRSQIVPYSPYYNPYSYLTNRYLTVRPSQISSASVTDESPLTDFRFSHNPSSLYYIIPKTASNSALLQYVKSYENILPIKYKFEQPRNAQKLSAAFPYITSTFSSDQSVARVPYLFTAPLEQARKL